MRQVDHAMPFLSNKLRTFIEASVALRASFAKRGFLSNKLRTFIEAKVQASLL